MQVAHICWALHTSGIFLKGLEQTLGNWRDPASVEVTCAPPVGANLGREWVSSPESGRNETRRGEI